MLTHFPRQRGAQARDSPQREALCDSAHAQLRGSRSQGWFIHSFTDLTLNWELVYLLMRSCTENEPKPASLPVTISLASPVPGPRPDLGTRGKTWGCSAEGLGRRMGWRGHAPPHYTRARRTCVFAGMSPASVDPGQCPRSGGEALSEEEIWSSCPWRLSGSWRTFAMVRECVLGQLSLRELNREASPNSFPICHPSVRLSRHGTPQASPMELL